MVERNLTIKLLSSLLFLLCLVGGKPDSALALGEVFIVPKEVPHTTYTKCENWAVPRSEYYSTTQNTGKENRCLYNTCGTKSWCDANPPDGTYLGTASAVFKNLPAGKYELWIHYRISDNRTHAFPWKITTDGTGNNSASGIVNQFGYEGCCGEWYLMRGTRSNPLNIKSTATVVSGSDTPDYPGYDRRSTSYGGVKLVRIGKADPEPPKHIPGVLLLQK